MGCRHFGRAFILLTTGTLDENSKLHTGVVRFDNKWVKLFGINTVLVYSVCPTLWDPMDWIAHQAPLSTGFFRSGLPLPPSGNEIKPESPASAGRFFATEP